MGRLAIVGGTWLAAVGLFAALIQWSGSRPPRLTPARDGVTALARSLNQLRLNSGDDQRAEWTVTRATSALRALVIDVDAIYPDNAPHIATDIVEPVRARYEEILIYVHALDTNRDPVVRRVEWTPRGGYVETRFSQDIDRPWQEGGR